MISDILILISIFCSMVDLITPSGWLVREIFRIPSTPPILGSRVSSDISNPWQDHSVLVFSVLFFLVALLKLYVFDLGIIHGALWWSVSLVVAYACVIVATINGARYRLYDIVSKIVCLGDVCLCLFLLSWRSS
jgi:hypothetical protein